jgi:hypothetical protein
MHVCWRVGLPVIHWLRMRYSDICIVSFVAVGRRLYVFDAAFADEMGAKACLDVGGW